MATSTGSQVKSNDHPDSTEVARFHIDHGDLRSGLAQVEDREFPEDFSSWAVEDRTPVGSLIQEGLTMAWASDKVPSWMVNQDNLLQLKGL